MLTPSLKSLRSHNPIRAITDCLKPPVDHHKTLINLALGDACAHGNRPPTVLQDAVRDAIESHAADGYLPSFGSASARRAVAKYSSVLPGKEVSEDDVIIASGCSGALDICISALVDPGDNILAPSPGFPLYTVIVESLGANCRHYNLLEDQGWEADLQHIESLVDGRTKAIIVTNPSNPTGAVYSAAHVKEIIAFARRHKLPIIADEIYAATVFDGVFEPFQAHAGPSAEGGRVPILSVGGLAKAFSVPGWRVGWVVCHDGGTGVLDRVRAGLRSLSQLVLGANSLVQAALPRVLCPPPGSADELALVAYAANFNCLLRDNAKIVADECRQIPSLSLPSPPCGAMYCMIKIDLASLSISDDTSFCKQILEAQNLVLLPGACFGCSGFVRIITCPRDPGVLREAFARIAEFCEERRRIEKSLLGGPAEEESKEEKGEA